MNRRIFMETTNAIISSPFLWESTRKSLLASRIYEAGDELQPGPDVSEGAEVILSKQKTINAALGYRGEKVAIHNFASATNPGGGVRKGSGAQEESICRTTTLYSVLDSYSLSVYYSIHHDMKDRSDSFLYTSSLIYTPDVAIIRPDDDGGPLLDESEYGWCDVVTIAAPHLGRDGMQYTGRNREMLRGIFLERFDRFFASASKAGCTVAITGAFGCGAFGNDPELVADALRKSISRYSRKFRRIELAVFCNDDEDANYSAFRKVFG